MNAEEAINSLIEGNKEYKKGKVCFEVGAAREATKTGQKPFATIVSCSDSRVVPEFIFNKNLGEIFIVRTAGNVVDKISLGSIEYGVEHLHTSLLVILGHEKCGAVTAACSDGHCEGNIKSIIKEINKNRKSKEVESAIIENAKAVADDILKKSKIVKELVKKGELKIVCMKYYFEDGRVEILK